MGSRLYFIALLFIVAAGCVAGATLMVLRSQAVRYGESLTQSFAQVVEEQTTRSLQTVDQRLQLAASGLVQLGLAEELNQTSARAMLQQQLHDLLFVRALVVLDKRGHTVFASDEDRVGVDVSASDYYQYFAGNPGAPFYVGVPARSGNGALIVGMARTLPTTDGNLRGAIVALVDPRHFESIWQSLPLGENGTIGLLRRDGTMLMRAPLDESVFGRVFSSSRLFSEMLPRAAVGMLHQVSAVDGISRLYAYRTLSAQPDLVVVVGRSEDETLGAWRREATVTAGIWLVSSLIILALCAVSVRAARQRADAEAASAALAQRLSLATEVATIGVWECDIATDAWTMTPTYRALLGLRPGTDADLDSRLLRRLHPDDAARVTALHAAALADDAVPYRYEARVRHGDGGLRWLNVVGRVVDRAADGSGGRLIGVIMDVSQQKNTEARLRESGSFNRAILDAVIDEIAVLDSEGVITAVNTAWRQFAADSVRPARLQHSDADVGANYLEACDPAGPGADDARRARAGIESVLYHGQPHFAMEYECGLPTEPRWFHMNVTPLGTATQGVVVAQSDITQRRLAEERLRELNASLEVHIERRTAELVASNKELDSFSYAVAHDLRAPLRSIDGFADVLEDEHQGSLDAAGRDALKRIRAAAQRMGELIDDLLRLSHVARAPFVTNLFDMSAMVQGIGNDLAATSPGRVVEVVTPPVLIAHGDHRLVLVLLENLLHNAWKFTSKRAIARVELGVLVKGNEIVYFIRDDGAGFDPAYAGKLFVAFQRLHSVQDFPGTGIGLATVQRIVQRHGGRVWAEGQVGNGATVYFTLAPARSELGK